jgi:hypothetical protein
MTHADQFLSLTPERRALAFEQAATALGIQAVILEKDFWVSWLLGLLFAQPELAPFLVFKGGTSLSKVFGVIDRFSEDIDLCLVPEFVGADAKGFDTLTSRVKRDAAVLEMQRLCADKVQQVLLPLLEREVINALGTAPAGKWLHYELDVDAKSSNLFFRYPSTQSQGFAYSPRSILRTKPILQAPGLSCPIRVTIAIATSTRSPDSTHWGCHSTTPAVRLTPGDAQTDCQNEVASLCSPLPVRFSPAAEPVTIVRVPHLRRTRMGYPPSWRIVDWRCK